MFGSQSKACSSVQESIRKAIPEEFTDWRFLDAPSERVGGGCWQKCTCGVSAGVPITDFRAAYRLSQFGTGQANTIKNGQITSFSGRLMHVLGVALARATRTAMICSPQVRRWVLIRVKTGLCICAAIVGFVV